MAFTRAHLIERLALRTDISRLDAERVVLQVFERMTQALNDGDRVELRDFGVFTPRQREAHVGRNPRTGRPVEVPIKIQPKFKAGRSMQRLLNGDSVALATLRENRSKRCERLQRRRDQREGQLSLF